MIIFIVLNHKELIKIYHYAKHLRNYGNILFNG